MFGAAAGRVSDFNQKNGKMIVFVLVYTELTLLLPDRQYIQVSLSSSLQSDDD